MVDPWIWAVVLLALGMGLAVLEVFFPSAGILGFLSISAMVGAVIMGFMQGPAAGLGILAAAVLGLPTIIVLAFRWWPKTKMGKQVLLAAPKSEDVLPDDADRRHLKGLVGHMGRAKCPMFPGGVVAVDGRTVDAVSEGMAIEAGQPVRVIKVQANRVVVRPVKDEIPSETAEDPLQRPIDSVLPDPFREPPLDSGSESGVDQRGRNTKQFSVFGFRFSVSDGRRKTHRQDGQSAREGTFQCSGGRHKPKTENRKPKTENRKPKTENRKPKTENRKPKTPRKGASNVTGRPPATARQQPDADHPDRGDLHLPCSSASSCWRSSSAISASGSSRRPPGRGSASSICWA